MFGQAASALAVTYQGTATVSAAELLARYGASGDKCLPLESVAALAASWRRAGQSIAFTNGCFDILHAGHVASLRQGRHGCDRLVVALNSDDSIRRLKGPGRPVNSAADRVAVLAALEMVDAVVVFDADTPDAVIAAVRPHVLFKGGDYRRGDIVGADFVEAYGGQVLIVPLLEGRSTTATLAAAAGSRQ